MDTSLYPPRYQQKLLTLLTETVDLDANTDGVLIHSDNFQALNLLQARYREQVKCIYIDPPYNTGNDGFIYKDNYQHSSWLTAMENRLQVAYPLLSQDGVNFISIDDHEQAELKILCNRIYGESDFVADFIRKTKSTTNDAKTGLNYQHEFLLCYAKNKYLINILGGQKDLERYSNPDNDPNGAWVSTDPSKAGYAEIQYYPIVNPYTGKVDYPPKGRSWVPTKSTLQKHINEGRICFKKEHGENERGFIYKRYLRDLKTMQKTMDSLLFTDNEYMNQAFTKAFNEIGFAGLFQNPKGISFLKRIIEHGGDSNSSVLDYFAGSGTTAHAVINLNREDGGKRKYILVEQGEYFDTVLKPRIQKVIYSENWKNGKPVENTSGSLNGVSQIVKVLKLESYEDTLNNIVLKGQDDFLKTLPENVREDYLLRYLLDTESKASLLNSDDFRHPFDYRLNIATDSAGAYQSTVIDLIETFNYLLGIQVKNITDEREKHAYVMIEGTLLNGESALIIWRDVEKMGYAEVAKLFCKQKIKPNSEQYDVIYLNGDHDMANRWQNEDNSESQLNLRAIEPEFLNRMFAEKGE
ncbi:site-specific DNA-methyltransferase [Avibacterium avium]|uniref:site-specific DNA-methyltransferase n=1 Tax=Avibacterium avium TaxID=751 RepID=UPI003BF895C2